ncbi:hypothetical protein RFI_02375, partial [Reticulomyxa filosa]
MTMMDNQEKKEDKTAGAAKFWCDYCSGNHLETDLFLWSICQHKMSRECAHALIMRQLNEKKLPSCMINNCQNVLQETEACLLLDDDELALLVSISMQWVMMPFQSSRANGGGRDVMSSNQIMMGNNMQNAATANNGNNNKVTTIVIIIIIIIIIMVYYFQWEQRIADTTATPAIHRYQAMASNLLGIDFNDIADDTLDLGRGGGGGAGSDDYVLSNKNRPHGNGNDNDPDCKESE